MGALPWVSGMMGFPWAAHGAVCSYYLKMAKSDHREGGITFESAKAKGFVEELGTKAKDFSKCITDIRALLWVVTLGGLALAAYCIYKNYTGALPWLSTMVGLPWSSHGVVCAFYLDMARSDHSEGGITFESAKAESFGVNIGSADSPGI